MEQKEQITVQIDDLGLTRSEAIEQAARHVFERHPDALSASCAYIHRVFENRGGEPVPVLRVMLHVVLREEPGE